MINLTSPGAVAVHATPATSHASSSRSPSTKVFDNGGGGGQQRFRNIKKIGYGAYGIVYSAVDVESGKAVAIKRNIITNPCEIGISTLREAETLTRIRGSPFVVDLLGFVPSSAIVFPSENLRKSFSPEAVDDKLHFIQPLADYNLSDALRAYSKKRISTSNLKHYTLNILLGLNWIHGKGIIHRDLKPANILVCKKTNTLKICDFGMVANKTAIEPTTPGVVTFWYRAPEISIKEKYSEKIDMWSLGAIMFEMISGKALFRKQKDNSEALIKHYFKLFPFQASNKVFAKLYHKDKIDKFVKFMALSGLDETIDFEQNSSLTADEIVILTVNKLKDLAQIEYSNSRNYTEDLFVSKYFVLMAKLLSLDPSARPSANECIFKSSLFEEFSPYISSQLTLMAKENDKVSPTYNCVIFNTSDFATLYRRKAYKLFIAIYNGGSWIPWYSHRILFHAIDLFETFVSEAMSKGSRVPESLIHNSSDYDIYLKVYTCLYIYHKIFITLEDPFEWRRFSSREFSTTENIKTAENFEFLLFAHVTRCRLYRRTLYEHIVDSEGRENKTMIKKCIQSFLDLDFIDDDDAIDPASGNVYFKSQSEIFERIFG